MPEELGTDYYAVSSVGNPYCTARAWLPERDAPMACMTAGSHHLELCRGLQAGRPLATRGSRS